MTKKRFLDRLVAWCVLFLSLAAFAIAEDRLVLRPDHDVLTKPAHSFVFIEGESVVLPVRAETENAALEGRRLKFEISDFWGARIESGVATLRRQGEKTTFTVRPNVRGVGWYRVAFQPEDAASPVTIAYAANHEFGVDRGEFLAFTIIPRPLPLAQRAKAIGIDSAAAYNDAKYVEISAELAYVSGVSWCRERWSWQRDHLGPGRYDWDLQDQVVNSLARRGIGVMNVFEDTPDWMFRDGNPNRARRYAEDLLAAYRFGVEIGERYKGKIFGWEIWNEQDIGFFAGGTPDHYAAMAKAVVLGMRAGDRALVISNGPFARRPNVFNDIMWENELTPYFNAYNFHGYAPFANGTFYRLVDTHLVEAQKRGFQDKEKWMSEMGAMFVRKGDVDNYEAAAHRQVHYVARAFSEYMARGVERLGWFLLRPWFGDGKAAGSVQSGLVRIDWTPFPAYTAIAVFASQLGKADYQGRLALGDVEGFVFDKGLGTDRDHVAVVWSRSDETVSLKLGALPDVSAVNVMGQPVPAKDGSIEVGTMPVYLNARDWGQLLDRSAPGPEKASGVSEPEDRIFDVVLFSIVPAERIISREDEPLENWDYIGTKWAPVAYRFAPGESVELTMDVHNFSDHEVSAVVRFDDAPGVEVTLAQSSVRVAPMSRAEVPFTVRTKSGAGEFRLKAQAEIAGRSTTPWLSLWQPAKDAPTADKTRS